MSLADHFKTDVRVTFTPANKALLNAAEAAYREELGPLFKVVVTSGNDGVHRVKSKHFEDAALDFRTGRTWMPPLMTQESAERIRARMAQTLGMEYDVVLEEDHLHGERDVKGRSS